MQAPFDAVGGFEELDEHSQGRELPLEGDGFQITVLLPPEPVDDHGVGKVRFVRAGRIVECLASLPNLLADRVRHTIPPLGACVGRRDAPARDTVRIASARGREPRRRDRTRASRRRRHRGDDP